MQSLKHSTAASTRASRRIMSAKMFQTCRVSSQYFRCRVPINMDRSSRCGATADQLKTRPPDVRYFRVMWTDSDGKKVFSDPIDKWTDAEMYRREIGGDAEVLSY